MGRSASLFVVAGMVQAQSASLRMTARPPFDDLALAGNPAAVGF
jgi:hypothetical protein